MFCFLFEYFNCTLSSGVHVQNMQVCYIGIQCHGGWLHPSSCHLHQVFLLMLSLPYAFTPQQAPCVMFPFLCPCVFIVKITFTSESMWCFVFCSCVSLLRMMISGFIYVPAKDMNSSFYMASQYSMVYMCQIFFIQFIIDGHLGWLQVFAIVNSAAINLSVCMCLYKRVICNPLDIYPVMGLLGQMVFLVLDP